MEVFALYALLHYPNGEYKDLFLGNNISAKSCPYEAKKAETQLYQTLSVAELVKVICKSDGRVL